MLGGRRGVEQARAGEQVGARFRDGEAAHEARENVLLHQRGIPREHGEHSVAVLRAVGFERPPAEQRDARVGGIRIAAQQRADQGQCLLRGQASRGGGELGAHFRIRLRGGQRKERRHSCRRPTQCAKRQISLAHWRLAGRFAGWFWVGDRNVAAPWARIAEQADAPRAHRRLRMRERGECRRFVERAHLMQRPQCLQRRMLRCVFQGFAQRLQRRGFAPLAEQAHGGLAVPAVRVVEQRDELRARLHGEIHVLVERRFLSADAVDAARARVDLPLVILPVRDVFLVEVRHVNPAIRRVREIHRTA